MRLTRLRAKCEVRRAADSDRKRIGGQACPERKAWPEQGRMGWLETECPEVQVQQPRRPVVDANAGNPRHGRSQSVRSSREASNDRGAKGHRKLVGAMTVEGYKRSSIVPQRLFVLEPQRPPEAGLLSEGPRQRERGASCAAWMGQSSVCRVRVSPFRQTSDWKAGCPKRACPVWREGRGSNPRPYPYHLKLRSTSFGLHAFELSLRFCVTFVVFPVAQFGDYSALPFCRAESYPVRSAD